MSTHSESPLVAKIRKLMAKANDPSVTEHEAAIFAAKVQELLVAHGLSMGDLGSEQVEEEKIKGRRHQWDGSPARQIMLRAVCKFYMCEAVGPARRGEAWTIIGRPTNVLVALDMFDYLLKTVIRLSNDYARLRGGFANKIDWRRGCMTRLAERLDEMRRAEKDKPQERKANGNPGNLPALWVDEARQVTMWKKQNMETKDGTTRVKQGNDAAHGRAAAEGIGLHRQVGGGAGRLAIGKK